MGILDLGRSQQRRSFWGLVAILWLFPACSSDSGGDAGAQSAADVGATAADAATDDAATPVEDASVVGPDGGEDPDGGPTADAGAADPAFCPDLSGADHRHVFACRLLIMAQLGRFDRAFGFPGALELTDALLAIQTSVDRREAGEIEQAELEATLRSSNDVCARIAGVTDCVVLVDGRTP